MKVMHIIIYEWNQELRPFQIHPRSLFSNNEIRDKWLKAILDQDSRKKKLPPLANFPNRTFSFFGKMDEGMK